METFWKFAVSITGISGVGAFVLYGLYKDWLHLPVLGDLTKKDKFRIFQLFLSLTFLFAIATLALGGYLASLDRGKAAQSSAELGRLLKDRHAYGEDAFRRLETDPAVPEGEKAAIKEVHREYSDSARKAEESIADGEQVRAYEHNKNTINLLNSTKARKAIPADALDDLKNKAATIPESMRRGKTPEA